MSSVNYLERQAMLIQDSTRTPQSQPLPGSNQLRNHAGGYTWTISNWDRLKRFLVLGSESGTYYVKSPALTTENANCIQTCIREDGPAVVEAIRMCSADGRVPKNDTCLFVLALCASLGNEETRQAAFKALPDVARIATHLFQFVGYVTRMRGWGYQLKRAVAAWYNRDVDDVAYQMLKYRNRNNWMHRDLLRLSHPKPSSGAHSALFRWGVRGDTAGIESSRILAYEQLSKGVSVETAAQLIKDHRLPRECVPTELLKESAIWQALLDDMPLTAMIRNLATMTRAGLFEQESNVETVCSRLNADYIHKSRVHPIAILAALKTYEQGRGERSAHTWAPSTPIVKALDSAFYLAFRNLTPTNQRMLVAIDVSASMNGGYVSGVYGLTPVLASAAMAMIHNRVEPNVSFVAFSHKLTPFRFEAEQPPLMDVARGLQQIPMGRTDCSLPMLYASKHKLPIDLFVIYTDNETWCGSMHPSEALRAYRQQMGGNAKLAVVGMTATAFTIADPNDVGMLDCVGFDTATPEIIHMFATQEAGM